MQIPYYSVLFTAFYANAGPSPDNQNIIATYETEGGVKTLEALPCALWMLSRRQVCDPCVKML